MSAQKKVFLEDSALISAASHWRSAWKRPVEMLPGLDVSVGRRLFGSVLEGTAVLGGGVAVATVASSLAGLWPSSLAESGPSPPSPFTSTDSPHKQDAWAKSQHPHFGKVLAYCLKISPKISCRT